MNEETVHDGVITQNEKNTNGTVEDYQLEVFPHEEKKELLKTDERQMNSDAEEVGEAVLQPPFEESSECPEKGETPLHNQNEMLTDLSEQVQMIVATQQQIKQDFNAKLKYDEHKEHLINKLHKELQTYKDDVVKSAIKPLIHDLIMLNDTIDKLVHNYRSSEEPLDAESILAQLENVTVDIEDVLYRQGIESFNCLEDKVNLNKQQILQTVKTNDGTKEKQIAQRMRKGYEWDDTIVRKEVVKVYVYDENEGENQHDE